MKRIITSTDLLGAGDSITIGPDDVLTPQARDDARARGIRVVASAADSVRPSVDRSPQPVSDLPAIVRQRIDAVRLRYPGATREALVQAVLDSLLRPGEDRDAGPPVRLTATEKLASFIAAHAASGVPPRVRHEVKRLVLNNLKASARASLSPLVRALTEHARRRAPGRGPHGTVLWSGTTVSLEDAAMINTVQFELLDYNETFLPTFVHVAPAVLGAAIAAAQAHTVSGARFLDAVCIGIEVELAVAQLLMPALHQRSFMPGVVVGRIGAAAAAGVIQELDETRLAAALGLSMLGAGGLSESVGSSAMALLLGEAARAGFANTQIVTEGAVIPATAFEGADGMLTGFGDPGSADAASVFDRLGGEWLTARASYKRFQTETISQAPVEAILAARRRAPDGGEVKDIVVAVSPIVERVVSARERERGIPTDATHATFDMKFAVASAWVNGFIDNSTYSRENLRDERVLAIRARVRLEPVEGLEISSAVVRMHLDGGGVLEERVDHFQGSEERPLSDEQLIELLHTACEGLVSPWAVQRLSDEVLNLDAARSVDELVARIRVG